MTVMKWWHLLKSASQANLPTSKVRSPNSSRHRHREASSSGKVSGPASRCDNATLTNGTTARPQFSTTTGQSGHHRGNLDHQLLNIRGGDGYCLVCNPWYADKNPNLQNEDPNSLPQISTEHGYVLLEGQPSVLPPSRAEGNYFTKVDIRGDSNNMELILDTALVANPNRARSSRYEKVDIHLPLDHKASSEPATLIVSELLQLNPKGRRYTTGSPLSDSQLSYESHFGCGKTGFNTEETQVVLSMARALRVRNKCSPSSTFSKNWGFHLLLFIKAQISRSLRN
ncbi:hypothetical protein GE21DRAFT_5366 [Neurospora crassa]|uniref:Uncharacterized protein n=1 Tax=Neurospora crassa (strain ATCC 24698 / 74-OR23-1A / CBS 708.71 / DSM 1257 / FGSC 987) TaxID=367110 RepID=Q7S3V2_NEUCR|nr:hypothetical protein NCU04915 [Neurospora crassa OR74A]EAA30127.3 hypothetical protein NCU04915 [Neurospora crassa OR74A]KHE79328.1 hypothetical protein GE21DRAFT_5366 [Neurospora crassa]|eukprot:XP_959363.3 hypothetical protein NCU04915 [Neurospora crassa OR74A]